MLPLQTPQSPHWRSLQAVFAGGGWVLRQSSSNPQPANAGIKVWSRCQIFTRTDSDGVANVRDGAFAIAVMCKHVKAVHSSVERKLRWAGCDLHSLPLLSRGAVSGIDQVGALPVRGTRCAGWCKAREDSVGSQRGWLAGCCSGQQYASSMNAGKANREPV